MKKRTFLTSVTLLATAMTATAGISPADFKTNSELSFQQDTSKQFVLEKKNDSNTINVAQHGSHSSHSSHSSHASSRY